MKGLILCSTRYIRAYLQVVGRSTYEKSLFRWHGFNVLVDHSGIQVLYFANVKNKRSSVWS
jgi:hypothetical protein